MQTTSVSYAAWIVSHDALGDLLGTFLPDMPSDAMAAATVEVRSFFAAMHLCFCKFGS